MEILSLLLYIPSDSCLLFIAGIFFFERLHSSGEDEVDGESHKDHEGCKDADINQKSALMIYAMAEGAEI